MATQAEQEAAAANRFLRSDDGKTLLPWMMKVAGLTDTIPNPESSDSMLRHMQGRQYIVHSLIQLAAKAE